MNETTTEPAEVEIELPPSSKREGGVSASNAGPSIAALLHEVEVKREVFLLFQKMDTNESGRLSTKEISIGFFLAGIKIEAKFLLDCISKAGGTEGSLLPNQFYHLLELLGKTKDIAVLSKLAEALLNSHQSGDVKNEITKLETKHKETMEEACEKESANRKRKSRRMSTLRDMGEVSDEKFVDDETCNGRCWDRFMTGKAFYVTTVVGWISVHVLLLCLMNGWDFGRAFYYSVQSGLSVGYGSLSEDKRTGSDLWGTCGTKNITLLFSEAYKQFPGGMLPSDAGGQLCLSYSEENEYADVSKFYTIIHLYLGASIISSVLGVFASMAIENSETWCSEVEADMKTDVKKQKDGVGKVSCFKKLADVYNGQYGSTTRAVVALFLWLLVGVLYGVTKEKWTFVTSLYFASAGCSTGGLQGPTPDEVGVWFTALYTLIGVPLYGSAIGELASGFSEAYVKRKKEETLNTAISLAEFNVASHLGSSDGNIDLFGYTLLQLYRLRKTDEEEIKEIRKDFEELDADKNGQFSRSEMQASMAFTRVDTDKSYSLDLGEVVKIVQHLQKEKCMEYPSLYMMDPEREYATDDLMKCMKKFNENSGSVVVMERGEFMNFWGKEFGTYCERSRVLHSQHMVELSVLLDRFGAAL